MKNNRKQPCQGLFFCYKENDMKKYLIVTYGCHMNKSDSERLASVIEKMGYKSASTINEADLIIVNMCSVRQSAVDRIYGLSQKFKGLRKNKQAIKTILTGCFLKKDFRRFKDFFDFILPVKTLKYWPEILKRKSYFLYLNQRDSQFNEKFDANYLNISPQYSKDFSTFIPISTGCNNLCSYCVVPFTRGPLICRCHKDILKEAENSIKKGVKEVWLLGQNINDYQSPSNSSINFPEILEMINNIPGNFWVRFTSSNPKDFSEELIEKISRCKKITEYLNLPVQSGDDKILKMMNRQYNIKGYKALVKKIRQKIPDISLSTDVIVGFPGETKKQFKNTMKLFKEIKFDMAYISQYSLRPATKAALMQDNVPKKEKERRWKTLTVVLSKTALKNNRKYLKKQVEVLVNEQKKGFLYGKTRTHKTVKIKMPDKTLTSSLIGRFLKVKIIDVLPWGLKGILKSKV